jgi:threonine dehydratase
LISGISSYSKLKNSETTIVGVEPFGCASMYNSLEIGENVKLENFDTFVDGASVPLKGNITYEMMKKNVDNFYRVPNGKLCQEIIDLYQIDGIIVEPAGALAISCLDQLHNLENKIVVCLVSGSNNDLLRYPEIVEKAKQFLGRRRYYIIEFVQKPGQLRKFINEVLGDGDDITRFEYLKKNNKDQGNVLAGIESNDFDLFESNLVKDNFKYIPINENDLLYNYMI